MYSLNQSTPEIHNNTCPTVLISLAQHWRDKGELFYGVKITVTLLPTLLKSQGLCPSQGGEVKKDMLDVSQIMKDLASMVHEQGDTIERVCCEFADN
ncbi:hypothetical protein EYF80_001364 [Liparis tanakae]|uniref:Uncharacterized protein n=1 Tax=Liparis tanakae TaxID=230148 RepID=A0A4Z2JEY9_9TELE|nr:hypothetical protein EYF80_001364 [Liparis tanakae]